uniref:Peptidase S1 domain-containing protein n=1 Tax=Anopheles coluzzii TaxID=1518534 RepID=A0A6E8W894_ANOCL
MANITCILIILSLGFIYGQKINGSSRELDPITTEAPLTRLIEHHMSIQQKLATQRAPNYSKPPLSRVSALTSFVQHLHNSNRTSELYKPFVAKQPTDTAAHDEQQPSNAGPVQLGLSNFLLVLSNLSNRPLSDQSAASSSGGVISQGISTVQETFSQVGSTIQNGINSVFGTNQANQASLSASWNPARPISSAVVTSQPVFCPSDCTMACGVAQKTASFRVLGGAEVTPYNKYPWIAVLQYYDQNVGTGTLINDRVVLTTGRIVSSMIIFNQIKVIFGVFEPNSTTESTSRSVFAVTRTKLHPQYSASNLLSYNIGLLQLAVPVTITDNFMPICLPSRINTFSNTEAKLVGWGAREFGGESWNKLQEATIPLYSFDECRLAYPNSTENNICGGVFGPAPKDKHKTSCDGDEGTGLMYPWPNDPSFLTLIGITIQIPGVGCGQTNEPAVFTKLYPYIPWVQRQSAGCYCKA